MQIHSLNQTLNMLSHSIESEKLGSICYTVSRSPSNRWVQTLYPEFYDECEIDVTLTLGIWQTVRRYV